MCKKKNSVQLTRLFDYTHSGVRIEATSHSRLKYFYGPRRLFTKHQWSCWL